MKAQSWNTENFDQAVAASTKPTLVDFWAEWCGPCKMMNPVLEQVATEQEGKAVIAKVNIDESPELAERFGITAIPTLIVFKNGQATTALQGVQSKATLLKALA